jgi:hypothetical protein
MSGPDDLRKEIVTLDIVAMLERKLEIGDCNEIRMILICVDILCMSRNCPRLSG